MFEQELDKEVKVRFVSTELCKYTIMTAAMAQKR